MYDLVIIGGGPAGLTAGIYAQRAKLKTVLLEKLGVGGQVIITDLVENYPGFLEINGAELMRKFEEHVRKFDLEIINNEVIEIKDMGKTKLVVTQEGKFETKSVIIASGTRQRKLGVKGEAEFTGRGVSYCATCDGFFFRGKDVVVVGGGDSAVTESLFLTKMVNKVYLVHRRLGFRAEKISLERAKANPKIEFVLDSVVDEITGRNTVNDIAVKNVDTNKIRNIKADGIFIYIGLLPNTEFTDVAKNQHGFILTDDRLETSVKGIFAAGDCRATHLRQIATAVGDGALAAVSADHYIEGLEKPVK